MPVKSNEKVNWSPKAYVDPITKKQVDSIGGGKAGKGGSRIGNDISKQVSDWSKNNGRSKGC